MNKQKRWRISRSIWSKLVVCDSDVTKFVQIRLTQQWSSFSRMILWWSDCSASAIVLLQSTSNVKCMVCDERKRLSKLLRQLFHARHRSKCHMKHERIAQIKETTSQMAKKWMRLKMFQHMHTNVEKLTSCWSVCKNWSYVDSLGLNACKWVAWRTGMNLFLWCGLVLFRLDETTNICVSFEIIYIYVYKNTGHNEAISFDSLWKEEEEKEEEEACTYFLCMPLALSRSPYR